MKLNEILTLLIKLAKENNLSTPFLCGGAVRDKVIGRLDRLKDLDITTGDEGSHYLAEEFAIHLKLPHKIMADGHIQVMIGNFKVDFSSNFKAPNIESLLQNAGLENPTEIQKEQYSRDFTCNTLLLTTDLKTIKDPIGLGLKDIKSKKLRTCLPASLTLGYDNKRVVRVLYLAAKLGFNIDDEIIEWIKENPQSIATPKARYVSQKLKEAFNYDKEKTLKLLDSLDLWKHLPPSELLMPYMSGNVRRI